MITSFEVGAVFRLLDEASPTLRKILAQVRELNAAIEKARTNLAGMSKVMVPTGMAGSVAQTERLAVAWREVAAQSAAATRAIGTANAAARQTTPPIVRGGGGPSAGGGGGRHRPGWIGGGSGAHVAGPGIAIPGGSHLRFQGGAMAGAGLLGYGALEEAKMEDAIFQLNYHAGLKQNQENRDKFRKIIQDSMSESGYSLHDVVESAKQEIRMFQGTPGGGIDVLPEMLRAATIEARLKGESPEESMKALIGLAHMTKQYSPEAIKKLAPAFAFLSTANPGSLSSIERSAGYAVPLLQSGLEIDPMQSLLLGTALTRAGATSTKSGTWLREMALRAMPGTSMMSKMAFKKHEEALKAVGLVDGNHKPTWFTDGKPDLLKMLDIAGANAQKIPIEKRAAIERGLFGAQGGGGFALLADPAVREQILSLQKEMNSPEFKNRYSSFAEAYKAGSPMQLGRTTIADFNIAMMQIGTTVLPSVVAALKDFDAVLRKITGIFPGGNKDADGNDKWKVGTRALEGAGLGALGGAAIGAFGGPVGAVGGALIGGAAGGVAGVIEGYLGNIARPVDRFGREIAVTGNAASGAADSMKNLGDAIRGLGGGTGGVFPGGTQKMNFLQGPQKSVKSTPISLSLNLDGRTLAQAITEQLEYLTEHATGAPSYNGQSHFARADSGAALV